MPHGVSLGWFTSDTNTGIYRPGSDNIAISTGGTERVRVDNNGKVGIGISAPTQALDVVGFTNVDQVGTSRRGILSSLRARRTLERLWGMVRVQLLRQLVPIM
jgi:hypothetical protein